jgi:hypothetical protein
MKIEIHNVDRAASQLKNEKAAGEDVITNEMVKSGELVIVEWFVFLFNLCMNIGNASEDWGSAIVVPLLKGKGDNKKCKNSRGISLLSMHGKVDGRMIIRSANEITAVQIRDRQCRFRKGRDFVDQCLL